MAEKLNILQADKKACFHSYMGAWLAEPTILGQMAEAVKSRLMPEANIETMAQESRAIFSKVEGVAIIQIEGAMMKADSKFGGTSTIRVRQAIRAAVQDPEIDSILLHIDSPGGTVSGTKELADEVLSARQSKPVHAYIEDLGASAAYWVASQCETISANLTAEVGSLGVVAVIYDQSKQFERMGVKVHVVSTGKFKGAGAPGSEISADMLAEVQELVDDLHEVFMTAVLSGRKMERAELDAIADGRVFLASKALKLGLVDAVETVDEMIGRMALLGAEKRRAEREKRVSKQLGQRR